MVFGSNSSKKGIPKINGNPISANSDRVKKALKKMPSGPGSVTAKTMEKTSNYLAELAESSNKLKVANVVYTLIRNYSSLVSEKNKSLLSSYNDNITSLKDIKMLRTQVQLGSNHSNQIKRLMTGPTYEIFRKNILDTRSDTLSPADRTKLKANCGINQRCYAFLSSKTFITVEDLIYLTQLDKSENKLDSTIRQEFNKMKDHYISNITKVNSEYVPKRVREELEQLSENLKFKFKKKQIGTDKIVKYFSAILETTLTLKITNMMPFYKAHIGIHLVKFSDAALKQNEATIDDIINQITYASSQKTATEIENLDYLRLEKIPRESIKKLEPDDNGFIKTMSTTLDINLTKNECFLEQCELLNTWTRVLGPRSQWRFEINEIFRNGIYLNKLQEFRIRNSNNFKNNTPISTFLIIESFGDNRSSAIRLEDGEVFPGVYSPCNLQFEFELSYKHLGKPSEPDNILHFEKVTKNNDFEDEQNATMFYPNRQQKFNVDFDEISIDGSISSSSKKKSPKKKYRLEINPEVPDDTRLESLLKSIGNLAGSSNNDKQNITSDDLPFINKDNIDQDEESDDTSQIDIDLDNIL